MAQMAADTAGLLDALGVNQAHVFGISMGGMIAQQLALNHPHKLNKLILGCTACSGRELQGVSQQLLNTPLLDLLFTQSYIKAHRQELTEFLEKTQPHHSKLNGLLRQLGAIATHETCNILTNIQVPTLVMTGDSDQVIPPENSELLAQKIPDAKLEKFSDAAHGFSYSHADAVAEKIDGFLQ